MAYAVTDRLIIANTLYKEARYEEAIFELEQLVSNHPKNADSWALLGAAHRDNWNKSEALRALKKALSVDKKHVTARQYLGELYIMLGSMRKAKKELKKLKKICGDCDQTFQLALMIQNAESGFCRFLPSNKAQTIE
ncbi:MAG: tetratricopeptide repeat protein [Granulosicoccus sp.]|nr:tetratricopeptide repeat protein [Granulosicoccus sp.]